MKIRIEIDKGVFDGDCADAKDIAVVLHSFAELVRLFGPEMAFRKLIEHDVANNPLELMLRRPRPL